MPCYHHLSHTFCCCIFKLTHIFCIVNTQFV
nr:MAG TPA: hypothetical protein [Caudoviricetes sp.]